MLCDVNLSCVLKTSLLSRSSQIGSVDGFLRTMAGAGFRSYPGRVDMNTFSATNVFGHAGNGVFTGFCSGGRAGRPGGGPLFTVSKGLGGTGTGMVGFLWTGHDGGLECGWGNGGGGPFGWYGTGGGG